MKRGGRTLTKTEKLRGKKTKIQISQDTNKGKVTTTPTENKNGKRNKYIKHTDKSV